MSNLSTIHADNVPTAQITQLCKAAGDPLADANPQGITTKFVRRFGTLPGVQYSPVGNEPSFKNHGQCRSRL